MTQCACERIEFEVPAQPVGYQEPHDRHAHAALRQKLWVAFIAALNDSKLTYCLLGALDGAQATRLTPTWISPYALAIID